MERKNLKKISTISIKDIEQRSQKYLQNDQFINILNDDCLKHIFKYLPITDKISIERGIIDIILSSDQQKADVSILISFHLMLLLLFL
jgi:hypothetical protein